MTLRGSLSHHNATNRRIFCVSLAVLAAAVAFSAAAGSASARVVRFHGYRLSLPANWRVYDLARSPSTCVRFNRHALYLGTPSPQERCPAHAVGRTEAVLLSSLSARGASRGDGAPTGQPSGLGGSAETFAVGSSGLVATATWSRDRALLSRVLGHGLVRGRSGRPPRTSAGAAPHPSATRAVARSAGGPYVGRGFDACAAPSTNAMSAWSRSPYRAVGVYIGGVNAACSQPNLTNGWVTAEVAAGWHLIPTYVSYQGAGACGGSCATIDPTQATSQGTAAAQDAVTQAAALGIPAGNPIYDDMEQYTSSSSNTAAVLAFLSGWTSELHAAGYLSGVYSSASSAITDLVNQYNSGYTEPDDLWIADWNGEQTTNDPYVPSSEWANHQRLHQDQGSHDETYGGATINIDGDFVDGATADTASPIPDGTFVQVAGAQEIYRIAGGAPLYVSSWTPFGGPQPVSVISARQFAALRPYPADGTFVATTSGSIYRIAGGAPIRLGSWSVFGTPQPDVTIDQWDIDNISSPLSHLLTAPADGTAVEGLPSEQYWSFHAGLRAATTAIASAIEVDDAGLAAFAQGPSTGGVGPGAVLDLAKASRPCIAPKLRHMTLSRARRALRRAGCRVGKVRRPKHIRRHHVLRVITQSAVVHSRHPAHYRINIRLR